VFAENLDVFVADFGVTVYFGSQTALAIFDQPDGLILSQRVISRDYRITYEASKLVGLVHGDTVYVGEAGADWTADSTFPTADSTLATADGFMVPAFTVLEITSIDDGAFFEARLEKQ
jgi:hypothetical protein